MSELLDVSPEEGFVPPLEDYAPDDISWGNAPHPAGEGATKAGPAEGAVAPLLEALAAADRAMAAAVELVRKARLSGEAVRTSGMLLERFASLAAGWTGADVRFLCRAEQALSRMPYVDTAFAAGTLSWGQVRGIVAAAKPLKVGQLTQLDSHLAGEVGRGEPDRIVQQAFGAVDRLTATDEPADPAQDPTERRRFGFEPDLFGGARYFGYDSAEAVATIVAAANAAADPPIADDQPRLDADGNAIPPELAGPTHRSAQLAEGVHRMARAFLDGRSNDLAPADTSLPVPTPSDMPPTAGPARTTSPDLDEPFLPWWWVPGRATPSMHVVIDLTQLHQPIGQLLARWHGGPIPLTRLTTERLLCDPALDVTVTDDGRPVAVGDSTAPITVRHRRALFAIDKGCRMPGCSAPAQHADAHHVIPREEGGATCTDNLCLLCRPCHTRLHNRGWQLEMDPLTRAVTVRLPDGRQFTSLPP